MCIHVVKLSYFIRKIWTKCIAEMNSIMHDIYKSSALVQTALAVEKTTYELLYQIEFSEFLNEKYVIVNLLIIYLSSNF